MTDKEIREAVENLERTEQSGLWGQRWEALSVAISLLKEYLSIEGFPEKLEPLENTAEVFTPDDVDFNNACNEVLRKCKLATMKKFSVERIKNILSKFREIEWIMANDSTDTAKRMEKRLTKTAQAIHKLLEEEE